MSEEKDDLKSIKVYKFNNTKQNWHEFALKFSVIADTRGYWEIIKGTMVPPDEQVSITVTTEDKGEVLKEKRQNYRLEQPIRWATGTWLCPLKVSHSTL